MSPLPHETRQFTATQGLQLTADCFGDPSDPPVLFFHGGGQTRHAWGGTAKALAENGWYSVTLDMRGHGDSDWSEEGNYYFMDYGGDATAVALQFGPASRSGRCLSRRDRLALGGGQRGKALLRCGPDPRRHCDPAWSKAEPNAFGTS